MDGEKIFGIGSDEIIETKKLAAPIEKEPFNAATQEKFTNALADKAERTQVQAAEQLDAKPNPIDMAKQVYTQQSPGPNTIEQLQNNISKVNDRISEIKETLESPDVTLKQSYQSLLENKLTHIDESLKAALDKVGIEAPQTAQAAATGGEGVQGAIQKFLGFLSNSQSQLQSVAGEVQSFRDKGKNGSISPADMLGVQLKVTFVQQELELFANLLNKALESTKTVMNVQI